MDTTRTCPSCGKALATDAPQGICPECLMKAGFGTASGAEAGGAAFIPPSVEIVARLFPQLEILELLGRGGMGAVYKARQPGLDRLVALKILPPRPGSDPGFAERFTREARALAKLSHPNIVAVYDFGQASNAGVSPASAEGVPPAATPRPAQQLTSLPYFIMEYVDGPNLRQLELAGKLSSREALLIVPQICEALQYAHDEGIVHRDIKPENVLLDKKGRVKIADFGLAKILGREPQDFRLTGAGQVMGTPHYMAPEQVEHPQAVDHRADIYSLGVVFYEMLTGELPLGKFAPPSARTRGMQIDVRLDDVVLRALEKEPERRYQTANQVKSAVETLATAPAQPPLAVPSVGPPSTNPWQPVVLLVGALVGAALLAVGTAPRFPVNLLLFLFGSFLVVVALIKLAGLWPFPSRLFPQSGFTGRNLRGSRPPAPLAETQDQDIIRQLKWPAIGLAVVGGLNGLLFLPLFVACVVPFGAETGDHSQFLPLIPMLLATPFVLCCLTVFAALKMMRLEAYGAAITASILAMLVLPTNVIGLPIGIWALVVLARLEVKAAFHKHEAALATANARSSAKTPLWFWLLTAAPAVLILAFMIMPHPRVFKAADRPIPGEPVMTGDAWEGWFPAGSHPEDYKMFVDRTVVQTGKASASIKCIAAAPEGFGTLMQMFKADAYRGKRVRLTGYVRARDAKDWAGLWMRVDGPDGPDEPLAFDNMGDRPIKGTSDWKKCEIVLDVPATAEHIAFGLLLTGAGQVWMDDLSFEVVGREVPTTGPRMSKPGSSAPANLNSESRTMRSFSTTDPTISKQLTVTDDKAWLADCREAQTVRLFEVANPDVEQCVVTYRAKLKSESLTGQAYLEMWCRFPGKGEFFSRGLDHAVSGSNDWASYETPFFLKKGERPDLIKLNVVVKGTGKVWVKDVELLKGPLPSGQ